MKTLQTPAFAMNLGPILIRFWLKNFLPFTLCFLGFLSETKAATGDVDALNLNIVGTRVNGAAVQADRKTIVIGDFTSVLGVPRKNIARLNSDGSLDLDFDPIVNAEVNAIAVQMDGKVLIGGVFTAVQTRGETVPAIRNYIARLNGDGSLDSTFDPNPNGAISGMALDRVGRILIGGSFTSLSPSGSTTPVIRKRMARLNSAGVPDPVFDPNVDSNVASVALQQDSKILLAGSFTSLSPNGGGFSISRNKIARLNNDGTLDAGFDPNVTGEIICLFVQPDQKILIGGYFTTISPAGTGQTYTRDNFTRLSPDGIPEAGFDLRMQTPVYHNVNSIGLQANGKIILGGDFHDFLPAGETSPVRRSHLARFNSDGSLDTTFGATNPSVFVASVTLQEDGKVLAGGIFSVVGAQQNILRNCFFAALNDTASKTVIVPNFTQVIWSMTGAAPEFAEVSFEHSSDNGGTWVPLGSGRKVGSNWSLNNLRLSSSGLIRARGRTTGGLRNSSSGLIEQSTSYSGLPPAPEIEVRGNGVAILSGSTMVSFDDHTDFGEMPVAGTAASDRTFTLQNTGTASLTLTGNPMITVSGSHVADFMVVSQPISPLAPGGTTSFVIRFDPTGPGLRQARVNISNSDQDESAFVFDVQGFGRGVPTLSNPTADRFTDTSADLGGEVVSDNRGTVTERGVVYAATSANPNPLLNGAGVTKVAVFGTLGKFAITVAGLMPATGYSYKAYATNSHGTGYSNVATFTTARAGDLDPIDFRIGGAVYAMALQPDGKLIVAGNFTVIQGVARNNIARLNANGTLDLTFDVGTDANVFSVFLQDDGQILIGGNFTYVRSPGSGAIFPRVRIALLNPNGLPVSSFNPRFDRQIYKAARLSNGKVLVAGNFTSVIPPGQAIPISRSQIALLNQDGSLDTGFDVKAGGAGGASNQQSVNSFVEQPDGKIVVGGKFTTLQSGGTSPVFTRRFLGRINSDGSIDANFDPTPSWDVNAMALDATGKILVVGGFSFFKPNGMTTVVTGKCAYLNQDGTVHRFLSHDLDQDVHSVVIQANSAVAIGGNFDNVIDRIGGTGYQLRRTFAKFDSNGTLDPLFDASLMFTSAPISMAIQNDGRLLIGGLFNSYTNPRITTPINRSCFARIINEAASQTLSIPDVTQVLWARSGSSPELTGTFFEFSADGGTTWAGLGNGVRIAGGWKVSDLALPSQGLVRARGRTSGGAYSASSGLVGQEVAFSNLAATNDIRIQGNGVTIASGDFSPTGTDHTDFGTVTVAGTTKVTRTFTLQNTGTAPLSLTGIPRINMSGAHASDFRVALFPDTLLLPLTNTVFQVEFNPSAPGLRTATITIQSNDTDESSYAFSVQGNGIDLPSLSPPTVTVLLPTLAGLASGSIQENNSPLLDQGFAWAPAATNTEPIIGGNGVITVSKGSGLATFSHTLTGLIPGTAYVLRTYATNAVGTTYSQPTTFFTTPPPALPTLVLTTQTLISIQGVRLEAEVVNDNGSSVIERGFVYSPNSLNSDPIAGAPSVTTVLAAGSIGPFEVSLSGLTPGTIYRFKAFATNGLGTTYSSVGTFATPLTGDVDSFGVGLFTSGTIYSMATQTDGKILVGGSITSVEGVAAQNLIRLNQNGTPDRTPAFATDNTVFTLAVQPDGKILVGGAFSSVSNQGSGSLVARPYLARWNSDGSLDTTFNPKPNGAVNCLLLQPDGKILVGGTFTNFQPNQTASVTRNRIARLNADGTLDSAFNPNVNNTVNTLLLQTDGKVLLGGVFTSLQPNGAASPTARNYLARLTPLGNVDTLFNPNPNNHVYALAQQPDGQLIVSGIFSGLQPNGATTSTLRNRIARLNDNGTLDASFDPKANSDIYTVVLQANGGILIGGSFTTLQPNGATSATNRNRIARLNQNGSLDTGFNPNANNLVTSIMVQNDGQILIGGTFNSMQPNGATPVGRNRLARLMNGPSASLLSRPTAGQMTWTRSGTTAEVENVVFQLSQDFGASWSNLGTPVRISDGWKLDVPSLPVSGWLRAIGRNPGGYRVASGGILEERLTYNGHGFAVSGKGILIADGDNSASPTDGTDFGLFPLTANQPSEKVFLIQNISETELRLGGTPQVTISGAHSGDFAVLQQPSSPLPSLGQSVLKLGFLPKAIGPRTALVTIAGNAYPFSFAISGTGQSVPTVSSPSKADVIFTTATLGGTITSDNYSPITESGVVYSLASSLSDPVLGGVGVSKLAAIATSGVFSVKVANLSYSTTYRFRAYATNAIGTSYSAVNTFTTATPVAGDVEAFSYSPPGFSPWERVSSIAFQPGGKTLVVVNGSRVFRYNQDGIRDETFDATVIVPQINGITVQADGKVLIYGSFTFLEHDGVYLSRNGLARLNADGTVDYGFDPSSNGFVNCVVIQEDGKILVGGGLYIKLSPSSNISRSNLARLNTDGTLDLSFASNPNNTVSAMAIQPDGRVLVAGSFSSFQPNFTNPGISRHFFARLTSDGTPEPGFGVVPNAGVSSIYSLLVQPDGKILVAGTFTNLWPSGSAIGYNRNHLARLNSDGSIDEAFDPNPNNSVRSLALQTDGKILVGGFFTSLQPNGATLPTTRNYLARLQSNGALDSAFDPNPNDWVGGIQPQPDGKIMLRGNFTALQPRGGLQMITSLGFARLYNDVSTTSLVIPDSTRIFWTRSGSGPEIYSANVELSLDAGKSWTFLGKGKRAPNGWRLDDVDLPANGSVRAWTYGGQGIIEQIADYANLPAAANLHVLGNAVLITRDDDTPDPADHTHFGSTPVAGARTLTRSFEIRNAGAANLVLGSPAISLSGTEVGDFTVTASPPAVLAPGDSGSFQITFNPSGAGFRNVWVTLQSNSSFGPHAFMITGEGMEGPYVVSKESALIADRSAMLTGEVLLDYGSPVSARGLIFSVTSLQPNPLLNGTGVTHLPTSGGLGVFSLPLSGLLSNTAYSFRAYATNAFGTTYSPVSIFRTLAAGVPTLITPNVGGYQAVSAMLEQPDGKLILCGSFDTIHGVPRRNLARLNRDGSLDTSFAPNPDSFIRAIALQADGKILLGGIFSNFQPPGATAPVARSGLARLHPDGSLDTDFTPNPDPDVSGICLQPDGKILICGTFTRLYQTGQSAPVIRNRIARLNPDGSLDADFNPSASDSVMTMALQDDGKILIGGSFLGIEPVGGPSTTRMRIARLNADGTLDNNFTPSADYIVKCLAVQSDGKILLGGQFSSISTEGGSLSTRRIFVARLESNGFLDLGFDPSGYGGSIETMALQADGRIILGGDFTELQPNNAPTRISRNRIARINYDGTLDVSFDPNANSAVYGLVLLADGSVLAGGYFDFFLPNGSKTPVPRSKIAILANDLAQQAISIQNGSKVSWLRTGSCPEVFSVVFELSQNGGSEWVKLGSGLRINGGWELSGLALPISGHIRGRGRTIGSNGNNSSGVVEQVFAFGFPNTPPIARASHTVTDSPTGGVQLVGLTSSDPDGSIASYQWTWPGGSASGASPVVRLPAGQTTVTLTVTDGQGATASTTMVVQVADLAQALTSAGLSGLNSQPTAIPFNDGVTNLVKFAFNLNLAGPDTRVMDPAGNSGLPSGGLAVDSGQSYWRLSYLRRRGSGLIYTPVMSSSLNLPFVPMTGPFSVEIIDSEWERLTVGELIPAGTRPTLFTRVEVSLP